MFSSGNAFTGPRKRKSRRSRAFSYLGGKDADELLESNIPMTWQIDKPIQLLMANEGPLSQRPITVMSAYKLTVEKFPTRVALAAKVGGVWEKWTYQDVYSLILKVSKGFIRLGLERQHGVAIYAYNSPEWVISHFAAIFAGGISSPLFCASSSDDIRHVVTSARCNIIVVNTDSQLEHLFSIRHSLPYLKFIVQFTRPQNLRRIHDIVISWAELLDMGSRFEDAILTDRIRQQAPNLCCSIVCTPGTTGNPKPVMISHDNVIWAARIVGRSMQVHYNGSVIVSHMPLGSLAVQVTDIYVPAIFAATVYFAPSGALGELKQTLREVRPTIFAAGGAEYERMRDMMEDAFANSNAITRAVIRWARSKGRRAAAQQSTTTTTRSKPLLWGVANVLVYTRLRRSLGVNRSESLISSSQPLQKSTRDFFASLDFNIRETYGLTEVTGLHTNSLPEKSRYPSVGQEMGGCGTNIVDPDDTGCGEIIVRGRHVCMGYLNMEEETKAAFGESQWFKTGDYGRRDRDGYVYVTGRTEDVVTLKTGEKAQSVSYEAAVKDAIPCVDHCMLVGNNEIYLSMLITLKTDSDPDTRRPLDDLHPQTKRWIALTGYQAQTLSQLISQNDQRLTDAIQAGIDKANENFPVKIERWKLLPQTFSFHEGELSHLCQMKRFVILMKYADDIRTLYPRLSIRQSI